MASAQMNSLLMPTRPDLSFPLLRIGLLALLLFASIFSVGADKCPDACAKDPAYKNFEYLQCAAYNSDPLLVEVWHNTSTINRSFKSIEQNNPGVRKYSKSLKKEIYKQSLPTCYENRVAYYLITMYMGMIKTASERLNKRGPVEPRYGSLPSTEINAFTIVDSRDERIVAFNTQLFAFSQQMSHVVSPMVRAQLQTAHSLWSEDVARQIVNQFPGEHLEFITALLEFLEVMPGEQLITIPGTTPLNEADDLALSLSDGMDLFAVGHEYSHVILKHTPVSHRLVDLAANQRVKASAVTAQVAVLSWAQELAADELGVQLLAEAARELHPKTDEWIYTLYGALYFFECMEILDEARYILDHGTDWTPHTDSEKAFMRALASGTAPADLQQHFSYLPLQDHPPAWLRMERVRGFVRDLVKSRAPSNSTNSYADLGEYMINYADFIWEMDRPKMASIIQKVQSLPGEPESAGPKKK
jgi:hypothetical protein